MTARAAGANPPVNHLDQRARAAVETDTTRRLCPGCARPMQRTRHQRREPGAAIYHARGLCTICYHRAYLSNGRQRPGRWPANLTVDPIAVERAAAAITAGLPAPELNPAERRAVIRKLGYTFSARTIADALHVCQRTITRARKARA